jgi:predicted TIM-barrel fold metal-dependent hydrolase
MNTSHSVFDFNVHLPSSKTHVEEALQAEASMTPPEMLDALDPVAEELGPNVEGMNVMLFDPSLFIGEVPRGLGEVLDKAREIVPNSISTTLVDFRHPDALEAVDRAKEVGVDGLKFHSYFQNLGESDIDSALQLALRAQRNEMFVCVCASYGTTRMYTHDNLKLAARLLEFIEDVPVILLHSGGLRALEAMLLGDVESNVWLETSFSINYWRGSRVENDLAFAYDKLGAERVIYGSDFPYVGMDSAYTETVDFLESHGFSSREIEKVLHKNATRLLDQVL